jgi:hypothetical protein
LKSRKRQIADNLFSADLPKGSFMHGSFERLINVQRVTMIRRTWINIRKRLLEEGENDCNIKTERTFSGKGVSGGGANEAGINLRGFGKHLPGI